MFLYIVLDDGFGVLREYRKYVFKLFFCQLRRVDDGLLQKAPGICLGRGYVTGVCISLG